MASNVSQIKMRTRTMAAPLSAYHEMVLAMDCGTKGCQRQRMALVRDLDGVWPGLTVGQAIMRLRCQACGAPATEVALQTRPGKRPRQRLALIGPGAYG